MAGSLNKVLLVGNLGKDPDVKHFDNGNTYARFPLATSETFINRATGDKITQTEWHNVVMRKGLATVAERLLHKGDKVFIEGRIRNKQWEDNGVKRYAVEIQADTMTLLSRREDSNYAGNNGNRFQNQEEDTDDDYHYSGSAEEGDDFDDKL
jgi:single-strand DNA-binding protein